MDLIKIYSHKNVVVGNESEDMLKLDNIAYAEYDSENEIFIIKSGKYKDKKINVLNSKYKEFDFVGVNLNDLEKTFDFEDIDNIDINSLFPILYYTTEIIDDKVCLKECLNKKYIDAFEMTLNPSRAHELEGIMNAMIVNNANGFTIPFDISQEIIGKSNSLLDQDRHEFCAKLNEYNIKEIYEELKTKIVGLDVELKQVLSHIIKNVSASYSSLSDDKIKSFKSTILILGYPGTGKTLMIESIAESLDVPCIVADANRYTPNGFEGANVEDMLLDLYYASQEDENKFEHGVIFIDEFDKLCNSTNDKSKNLKNDVQKTLLRIIQGTQINKKIRVGLTEKTITLNTSKITFILSGVFKEILDKNNENIQEDLINYGMEVEIVDRILSFIKTHMPSVNELKSALKDSKISYLNILKEYLNEYGVSLNIDDEFIDEIAKMTYSNKQSYRGLSKSIDKYIDKKLFDILSGDVKTLTLNKNSISEFNNE